MNSCDFFIKQVYCLGLHFVTRLKILIEIKEKADAEGFYHSV